MNDLETRKITWALAVESAKEVSLELGFRVLAYRQGHGLCMERTEITETLPEELEEFLEWEEIRLEPADHEPGSPEFYEFLEYVNLYLAGTTLVGRWWTEWGRHWDDLEEY